MSSSNHSSLKLFLLAKIVIPHSFRDVHSVVIDGTCAIGYQWYDYIWDHILSLLVHRGNKISYCMQILEH